MNKQTSPQPPVAETFRTVAVDVGEAQHIAPAVLSALLQEHKRRGQRIKDLLPVFSDITKTRVFPTTIARLKQSSRSYSWDLCLYLCGVLGARVEIRPPRTVHVVYLVRP